MTTPRVGLMLYTIREDCARDFESSLRTVAELGYDGVELFDLHGHDAATVRGWLDDLGLEVAGRHAGLGALEDDLPALAEELRALGSDRIVLSWIDPPQTAAEGRAACERIEAVARNTHDYGLRFGFHNHWSEVPPLDGGDSVLEELRRLPPELLWFELDLGWAWEAEADPVDLLRRMRDRSPVVHVKDLRARGTREYCPVGDGAVGYERVLPAAVELGVEWLLVEQDEIDGEPFAAIARSLAAVRGAIGVAA
jgi:sugar phosphate isomerase/epimerase